jgi:hypothetical protein
MGVDLALSVYDGAVQDSAAPGHCREEKMITRRVFALGSYVALAGKDCFAQEKPIVIMTSYAG